MEILFDLLFAPLASVFGALVGVLYPPKSPGWARAQKAAAGLLAAAIIAWAAAYVVAGPFGVRGALWPLLLAGVALFLAFLVVGNKCRRFHERNQEDDPGAKEKR